MGDPKNIFISSIYQNAGKTTISLGLYKILQERKFDMAFMKPVGQEYVTVGEKNIDKDSFLIGQVYRCRRKFKDMSPITVGRGFTERYIFEPRKEELQSEIVKAYKRLSKGKELVIVEGTGHAGVGSVIDCSNADVASILNAKGIIVSEGGIGRCIDEIMLNKALFDLRKVEVLGVIVNKVIPEKYDKIQKTLKQGLANKGIKLLGVIPVEPMLSAPTVEQLMQKLQLKLFCGRKNIGRRIQHTIVAAMEPHNMISQLRPGTLVITSGDRVDNILVAVSSHLVNVGKTSKISGVILTGGLVPNAKIVDLLKESKIPVLISEEETYSIAAQIEHLTCKIQKSDKDKILEAERLVRKYVDTDAILAALGLGKTGEEKSA